jgi:two-component system sensor histidine kinase YesM
MSLLFVVAFLIPNILIAGISYAGVRGELLRQAAAMLSADARRIAEQTANQVSLYTTLAYNLQIDATLYGYLTLRAPNVLPYYEAYVAYIDRLAPSVAAYNRHIDSIAFYPFNPSFPTDGLYVKKLEEAPFTLGDMARMRSRPGQPMLMEPARNSAGMDVIPMAWLLTHRADESPFAVLVIQVRREAFASLIAQESRDTRVWIVSRNGALIAGSEGGRAGADMRETLTFLSGADGKPGSLAGEAAGEVSLIAYEVGPDGWMCAAAAPTRSALGGSGAVLARILLLTTALTALSVSCVVVLSGFMTRRVRILTEGADRLAEGYARGNPDENAGEHFQIRLPDLGEDEIGRLGKAFGQMVERLRVLVEEGYRKELRKQRAELQSLQNQINPHFMYNALGSIASLSLKNGDTVAYQMCAKLARFYRTALSKGRSVITLKEELALCGNYLDIERIRFPNLVDTVKVHDESLLERPVVKLILQPLLENAISHGLYDCDKPFHVLVTVERAGGDMLLVVRDFGAGMTVERLARVRADLEGADHETTGLGMRNVQDRIKLYYGEGYGLEVDSAEGLGTTVRVRVSAIVTEDSQTMDYDRPT